MAEGDMLAIIFYSILFGISLLAVAKESPDLIKMIESTPDTIITLINGDTLIVKDSVDDVVRRAIDYQRQVHGFNVV